MSSNWFNIPDKSTLTESNICEFCAADKDECGEYAECCYRSIVEEDCSNTLTLDSKGVNIFDIPHKIKDIKKNELGHFEVVAEADLYDSDNKVKGKVEVKIPCVRDDGVILPYEVK